MDPQRATDTYIPSVFHKRSRSRSPSDRDARRHRSRSPLRSSHHQHYHHHHHHRSSREDKDKTKAKPSVSLHTAAAPLPAKLPYKSPKLHKHELDAYEALFAEYLDVQKRINLRELDRNEVKGRWKSFIGKWNRGELAEGWYDPEMKVRVEERYDVAVLGQSKERASPQREIEGYWDGDQIKGNKVAITRKQGADEKDEDGDDDGYGPALPNAQIGTAKKQGPAVPRTQDLQERDETLQASRSAHLTSLHHDRKQDRQAQRERLDELAPRAEPGTRERQLEKKREVAASNREFKDAKEAGDAEVGDGELMGDDEEGYKREKKKREKVKNERELRKEEILRARAAEREERMVELRGREARTMDMLKGLAKARFG